MVGRRSTSGRANRLVLENLWLNTVVELVRSGRTLHVDFRNDVR